MKIKYFIPALFVLTALVLGVSWPGTPTHANPLYVGTKAKSATATTTLLSMSPGLATSTTIYDSYEINGTNQTNGGQTTLPDSVAFLLQGNASSTLTVLNIQCEFGDDELGSTGISSIDWYQNEVTAATTTNAGAQNVSIVNAYTFTFASSTVGGANISSTTTRFAKLVTCPAPTRYVRALVTVTGGNALLWVGIVPKKQRI